MAWAKVHTDILGDDKLMRAARKGARHLLLVPWLIVFAKRADDNGRLTVGGEPAEPEDIAEKCPGATAADVTTCLDELERLTKGVIRKDRDGAYRFLNWGKRQDKPSNSPESVRERVQRHRERKRREQEERDQSAATPDAEGTSGNQDGVNAPPVTPRNAIEVEGEVEGETEAEGEENREQRSVPSEPASRAVAAAEAADQAAPVPEPSGRSAPLAQIAGAVRKVWWAPDGKPPAGWLMERELSIWKPLLDAGVPVEECIAVIHGASYLQIAGGVYGRARFEPIDWLKRGEKLTGRLFKNTRSGAVPIWTLALEAYDRGPPTSAPKKHGAGRQESRKGPERLATLLPAGRGR